MFAFVLRTLISELAKVPVLVVTAIGATATSVDVRHKPVDVDALLRTIARYCD